jgi:alkylation response protein AidB-like acyl-CoA dehydrogenase
MDFDLTKEQQLLSDAVQRFVGKEYSFAAREAILDSKEGWSREIWAKLAELGLLGLQVPEEHGGMGGAMVETMLTMNALGRGLLLEPYLPSAILATALIRELGSPAQKEELLPALAAGERIAVPAHGEPGARDDLARVATTAARAGDGYALNGRKTVIVHAPAADALLVSARTSGKADDPRGISLFIVPRSASGLSLQSYRTLDGQRASDVSLRHVRIPAGGLLGPEGGAFEAISAAWDLGVAAICAEAAGALQALLDSTVEYAKTRKQFGVPIGKFQALQHRMVEMLLHVEQVRSMSYLAAIRAIDGDPAERRRALSAAKVVIGQACRKVAQEAVQIHGGMGMTDELHVGHYFKRLTTIELSLGDTEHHLERFVRETAARKEIA